MGVFLALSVLVSGVGQDSVSLVDQVMSFFGELWVSFSNLFVDDSRITVLSDGEWDGFIEYFDNSGAVKIQMISGYGDKTLVIQHELKVVKVSIPWFGARNSTYIHLRVEVNGKSVYDGNGTSHHWSKSVVQVV